MTGMFRAEPVSFYCGQSIATDESVLHFLKRCNEDMLAKMMKVYSIYTKSFLADAHDKTSAHSTTPGRDDSFLGFVKETFGLYLCVCENQFRRPFKEFVRRTLCSNINRLALRYWITYIMYVVFGRDHWTRCWRCRMKAKMTML